jgi:ABC-type multidrug transport system fused ATPase/permease subunit
LPSTMLGDSIAKIVWVSLTARERRKLILIWVLILIGMVLETFSLGMVLPLIAVLTNSDGQSRFQWLIDLAGNPSQESLVMFVVGALFVVFVLKNVFAYFSTRYQRTFLNDTASRLSQKAFRTYLRQPYEFHLQRNSATLINNAEIAKSIVSGGLEPFLTLLTDGLIALGLFALLILVEPVGSLITLAVFGLASYVFQLATRDRIVEWGRLRKKHLALVLKHLQQGLGGAKEVKLLGREKKFLADHERHLFTSMDVSRRFAMLQMLPKLWLEVMGVASLAVLVFTMSLSGKTVEEILPVLGLFAATAFRIIPSVGRILASFQGIAYSAPQIRSVHDDLVLEPPDESTVDSTLQFEKSITFDGVSFKYESAHKPSLSNVSFSIARGESIGIVGPSGAGKSTLVDVLLGLLQPTSGRVLVDGVPIVASLAGWQRHLGYVPQSIYLIDDTLAKNVAFGLDDAEIDQRRVREAIELAQLSDFVDSLPLGAETVVGERGVRLSGGQRQRIGIARALYENPSILVLDEATSALDNATEAEVMDAVRQLQSTRTVIIVAHRLTTVAHCDRIIRIDDARLEEVPVQEILDQVGAQSPSNGGA